MATLTLQPDATAGKDNGITWQVPSTNYGTAAQVNARFGGLLIEFGLSDLSGKTTTSAVMSIYYAGSGAARGSFYRLKRSWTEAGSTWYTYDGTNSWQVGGATGADDSDSTAITPSGASGPAWWSWDVATDVALFAAGTVTNYGWRQGETGTNTIFNTSDYTTDTSLRPKFTAEYTEGVVISPFVSFKNI
jgi:hypothetical protein